MYTEEILLPNRPSPFRFRSPPPLSPQCGSVSQLLKPWVQGRWGEEEEEEEGGVPSHPPRPQVSGEEEEEEKEEQLPFLFFFFPPKSYESEFFLLLLLLFPAGQERILSSSFPPPNRLFLRQTEIYGLGRPLPFPHAPPKKGLRFHFQTGKEEEEEEEEDRFREEEEKLICPACFSSSSSSPAPNCSPRPGWAILLLLLPPPPPPYAVPIYLRTYIGGRRGKGEEEGAGACSFFSSLCVYVRVQDAAGASLLCPSRRGDPSLPPSFRSRAGRQCDEIESGYTRSRLKLPLLLPSSSFGGGAHEGREGGAAPPM